MYNDLDEPIKVGVKSTVRGFKWQVTVTADNLPELLERLGQAIQDVKRRL